MLPPRREMIKAAAKTLAVVSIVKMVAPVAAAKAAMISQQGRQAPF
jgi:hypothetical protein